MALVNIKFIEIQNKYPEQIEKIMDKFKVESKDIQPENLKWEFIWWDKGYRAKDIEVCLRASYGIMYNYSDILPNIPDKVLSKLMLEELIK